MSVIILPFLVVPVLRRWIRWITEKNYFNLQKVSIKTQDNNYHATNDDTQSIIHIQKDR